MTEYEKGTYMSSTTVTWQNSCVTSLPAGYTTATQTIATAEWCYNNDITYINGGKIYTGSIKAAQIDVANLFAQDITATGTIHGVKLEGATGSFSGSVSASSFALNGVSMSIATQKITYTVASDRGAGKSAEFTGSMFTIASDYGLYVNNRAWISTINSSMVYGAQGNFGQLGVNELRAYKIMEDGAYLSSKYAAISHGNHVPTTQAANNAKFLRCDNTWQMVTPANIGAAASSHTHADLQTQINTLNSSMFSVYPLGVYDVDSLPQKNGIYTYTNMSPHIPYTGYGVLIHVAANSAFVQLAFSISDNALYSRIFSSGAWSAWVKR